ETLIPNSPKKPIRVFISVGDQDLLDPNVMRDGMHDWVEANNRMANVLKAKGYEYQYLFCRGSGHGVGNAKAQFLPHAIEWVWKGYAPVLGQAKKDEKADNEKTQLNKALNLAAALGKLQTVKDLVKKGADIQWRDPASNGKTPLVRAIMSGNLEVVK